MHLFWGNWLLVWLSELIGSRIPGFSGPLEQSRAFFHVSIPGVKMQLDNQSSTPWFGAMFPLGHCTGMIVYAGKPSWLDKKSGNFGWAPGCSPKWVEPWLQNEMCHTCVIMHAHMLTHNVHACIHACINTVAGSKHMNTISFLSGARCSLLLLLFWCKSFDALRFECPVEPVQALHVRIFGTIEVHASEFNRFSHCQQRLVLITTIWLTSSWTCMLLVNKNSPMMSNNIVNGGGFCSTLLFVLVMSLRMGRSPVQPAILFLIVVFVCIAFWSSPLWDIAS